MLNISSYTKRLDGLCVLIATSFFLLSSNLDCVHGQTEQEFEEYGQQDLLSVFKLGKGDDGEETRKLDVDKLDKILDELRAHAISYPPRFKNQANQERAKQDARILGELLDTILNKETAEPGMLFRAATVLRIGHNLDVKGSAAKADAFYERLLELEPDSAEANHHYGVFLVTSTRAKKSVPYLKKALALGVDQATSGLAMAYVAQGELDLAKQCLKEHLKKYPDHQSSIMFLDAIEKGNFKVQKSVMKDDD